MVSEEQVTSDRSHPRRRRRGIGGRRWWAGCEVAATPSLAWKHRGGDSDGGTVTTVSARKLAASLWRQLAAITNGGGSVRRQCGLSFDRLGFEVFLCQNFNTIYSNLCLNSPDYRKTVSSLYLLYIKICSPAPSISMFLAVNLEIN